MGIRTRRFQGSVMLPLTPDFYEGNDLFQVHVWPKALSSVLAQQETGEQSL